MKKEDIQQERIDYLKRVRSLFQVERQERKTGIPKRFMNINPSEEQKAHPQSMLPLFEQMMLSIPNSQTRLIILNGLVNVTLPHVDPEDIKQDNICLQKKIFQAITGHEYKPPKSSHLKFPTDMQNMDFYELIGLGILAYENSPAEIRNKFNKAIMPVVKKQKIVVPHRLQHS